MHRKPSEMIEGVPYKITGHMKESGHKFVIDNCYLINDIWYRPILADQMVNERRQPLPEEQIGWDLQEFTDDAIIDSWEKEPIDKEDAVG